MDTPEITFVLPGVRPLGGVRAVLEIADHLRDRGYTTQIVVPERTLLAPKRSLVGLAQRYGPRACGPFVQRLAPARTVDVSWFDLQTPLVLAGPDLVASIPATGVVIATSYRTAEALRSLKDLRTRGVYLLQAYETWSGPAHRVDATWRAFAHAIATAPWLAEMAMEHFGYADVPVAVYGVDHDAFSPREPALPPSPSPVVGFLWDDRPIKGGDIALAAFSSLRSEGVAASVQAYGLGDPAGLPSWVDFRGELQGEALAAFYRELDLWVAPGRKESGPMSVPEAMVSGVPVASTDTGDVRIWSQDGRWCALVPPHDVAALATAIRDLLADPSRRATMAARAREHIAGFTWAAMTDTVEAALIGFGLLPDRPARPT